MATNLDPEATARAAQQILNKRIDAVRALVDARTALDAARQELAVAEQADIHAYKAATKAGWSSEELRQLELPEPGKITRVRRARSASRQPVEQPSDQHNPDQ